MASAHGSLSLSFLLSHKKRREPFRTLSFPSSTLLFVGTLGLEPKTSSM